MHDYNTSSVSHRTSRLSSCYDLYKNVTDRTERDCTSSRIQVYHWMIFDKCRLKGGWISSIQKKLDIRIYSTARF